MFQCLNGKKTNYFIAHIVKICTSVKIKTKGLENGHELSHKNIPKLSQHWFIHNYYTEQNR